MSEVFDSGQLLGTMSSLSTSQWLTNTKTKQEQYHKEWEYVDILPQNQNPRPKVAGKYGHASNVYAIGLVSSTSQYNDRILCPGEDNRKEDIHKMRLISMIVYLRAGHPNQAAVPPSRRRAHKRPEPKPNANRDRRVGRPGRAVLHPWLQHHGTDRHGPVPPEARHTLHGRPACAQAHPGGAQTVRRRRREGPRLAERRV